jgi:hypothetical protein
VEEEGGDSGLELLFSALTHSPLLKPGAHQGPGKLESMADSSPETSPE